MAKKQVQTDAVKSLNPFNEGIVKIISASVAYNSSGRSVLVRTFQTIDGKQHTITDTIDSSTAKHAIELCYRVMEGVGSFTDDFAGSW